MEIERGDQIVTRRLLPARTCKSQLVGCVGSRLHPSCLAGAPLPHAGTWLIGGGCAVPVFPPPPPSGLSLVRMLPRSSWVTAGSRPATALLFPVCNLKNHLGAPRPGFQPRAAPTASMASSTCLLKLIFRFSAGLGGNFDSATSLWRTGNQLGHFRRYFPPPDQAGASN